MCGRYRRTTREEELARIYRIPIPSQPDLPISYNIALSQEILALQSAVLIAIRKDSRIRVQLLKGDRREQTGLRNIRPGHLSWKQITEAVSLQ